MTERWCCIALVCCESMVDQSSWDASAAGSWDWWTRCIISSALHSQLVSKMMIVCSYHWVSCSHASLHAHHARVSRVHVSLYHVCHVSTVTGCVSGAQLLDSYNILISTLATAAQLSSAWQRTHQIRLFHRLMVRQPRPALQPASALPAPAHLMGDPGAVWYKVYIKREAAAPPIRDQHCWGPAGEPGNINQCWFRSDQHQHRIKLRQHHIIIGLSLSNVIKSLKCRHFLKIICLQLSFCYLNWI